MKKFKPLFYYFPIFLLMIAVVGSWFWWATGSRTREVAPQIFVIQRGEKTDLIVKRLEQEKLIRNSIAFKLVLYKEGLIGRIQAGDFRLSPSMNAWEIAQSLTHGTLDHWVTIIEGWRSEEIAAELGLNPDEFIKNEGYLFPDTYLIPKNASPAVTIEILRNNFDQKINSLLPELKESGLILEQVVILASLIEREVKLDEDRAIVAGILIKRWQNGWPLQVDATVQYALGRPGDWWPKVEKVDLNIKSSFNTYFVLGLPPGPICNPGLASLKAVINPQATNYWFYLSDSEGKMHYATSNTEHNENISKYL